MQKKKLETIEHEKKRRPSVYLFYRLRSYKEMECPRQISRGTLATKATFQNLPNGKKNNGKNKITYPSIYRMFWYFQSYIIIYFILESKSFCQKWVFIFTLYSFERMTFDSSFWVFSSKWRVMVTFQAIFVFFELRAELKKYWASFTLFTCSL